MAQTRRAVVAALFVVASVIGGACGSGTSDSVATDGSEVVRYAFDGSPSTADQERTVAVLNTRFEAADVAAQAALDDGVVVVRAAGTPAPSADHIAALAQPGALQFRAVLEVLPSPDGPVPTSTVALASSIDPGAPVEMPELDQDGAVIALYHLGPSLVDGSSLESATYGYTQQGEWQVQPVFKAGAEGIVKLNATAALCNPPAASCPTGQLAVTLDGRVILAPTLQESSFERDEITISGNLTEEKAGTLAALLDSGSLPATLRVEDN